LLRASPRGRWFLAEYARRNRTAETDLLLEAIGRNAQTAAATHSAKQCVRRTGRYERGNRTHQTRDRPDQAAASIRQAIDQRRREELDHIVEATEKATSDILEAAEEIQEVAWILREKGTDMELCDKIDQRATDIYTACSFQDITGQRTEKVVKALRFIEQRINAMIEIWGSTTSPSRWTTSPRR
jgi:chemotaxis regulatin CheY-phosphate phosphatase CheZ